MAKDQLNALPAGYQLDDFTIESILGAGGFGITYLAHERTLDRKVAIKEYLPRIAVRGEDRSSVHPISGSDMEDFEYGLKRFKDEAQTLVGFRHPNIVTVFRYLQANGTAYIVMEYVKGKSLEELLQKGSTLDENEAREVLFPLLDGMEAVHKTGFLHRDIKPGNIFVQENGVPILLDFGAARHALGAHSQSFTGIVTPGYAPFEQYATRGNQGAWTDIYGFGATLYRAITGHKPPEATDRIESDDYVPAAQAAAPGFSPGFLAAIDAALIMRAADRPQSVADWRAMFMGQLSPAPQAEAVQHTLAAGQQPVPQPTAPPSQPHSGPGQVPPAARRAGHSGRAALIIVAIVLGVGALAGGGYWGWTAYEASEKTRLALEAAKREAELARQRAEEASRQAEAEAKRRAEEERRRRAETARRRAEEERRRRGETARRQAEEARRQRAEAARRRAEEERRRRAGRDGRIQRRTYSDGGRYVGPFRNGKRHGIGKYWWPNRDRYEGAWVDGQRTGYGRYWWGSGNRYVGNFRNGRLHGRGTFYWTDGGRYIGYYRLGKRHGTGKMFWASGGRYSGQWRNGKRANGTYWFPDGRRCRSQGNKCVGTAR